MSRFIPSLLCLPPALLGIFLISATPLRAQNTATTVTVDAAANQHPINPNIYGIGGTSSTADMKALNVTLNRNGGNNESDYNWQQDAINLDADWYFESYLMHGPPVVPGQDTDIVIQNTRNAGVGAEPMVTIPMLPYIAKVPSTASSGSASLWSFSVAKYGAQVACNNLQAHDPYQADAGSGCVSSTKNVVNDPADAYVANSVAIQKGYVQHLVSKWGDSTTATGIKYYVLDNEPSLWASTHRDVHPNPETYEEEYNNIVKYATMIRSVDPNAKIIGPEEWIWWAMFSSGLDQKNGRGAGSDYATHNNTYYYPYLLQKLYAYQQSSGIKMLDVLTVHCYTDAPANTFNVATRQLWDPNYVDPNWEGPSGININGGVQELIPLMKQWVSQYYPGLEIGCTEYSWGNDNSLSGATAEADALGIFGLYGMDLATNWGVPPKPGYLAMQMYRNYDGKFSTFGDTSVAATAANVDKLSAFAALRSSDKALTVMVINKQTGNTPVTVNVSNFLTVGPAKAYRVSSATQTSIYSLGSMAVTNNAITFTAPSQSVTLLVIPAEPNAATPTFSPAGGTFTAPQKVTLSDATPGAVVYYTTDGKTAPSTSSSKYTGPIAVNASETIQAMAVAAGYLNSAVASATYTLQAAAPTITPKTGTYGESKLVTMASATPGAVIHYTLNGSTPTVSSAHYTAPFPVNGSVTVKAIATEAGFNPSTVSTAIYTLVASPQVLTGVASAITTTSATLTAAVNDHDAAASVWFLWSTNSASLTSSTAKASVAASASNQAATASLTGLTTKTTYYFRPVVSTVGGVSYGAIQSFTTE